MPSSILQSRPCPGCKKLLSPGEPGTYAVQPAGSFAECLRRCDGCGIGLSNTSTVDGETIIYKNLLDNIPEGMRAGFIDALRLSVNIFNRSNKERKAAFSTSEDALTWTAFRWLQTEGRLRETCSALGLDIAKSSSKEPILLLWGAQVPNRNEPASHVASVLKNISTDLGEIADRRTEPDVVLDFGDAGVVFAEVKFRSGNDSKDPKYANWDRYLERPDSGAFLDPNGVRENGHYELARNWRFAWEVSRKLNVPVGVVNLGSERLFKSRSDAALKAFVSLLNQDPRHQFYRITWRQLFEASGQMPAWFPAYAVEKRLDAWGCYGPPAKAA
jgi:hypothetical protein